MSVEGVSGDLDQNSGEIKVRYIEETMTIDNKDNKNTSLVLMGYPAEGEKSKELGNLSCKQIGESIDESALIFNDMRSVEEWLRNRSDIDYDAIRNDYLCFNSDEISVNNEVERTVLPLVTTDAIRNDYLCFNSDEISVNNEVERTVLPLVTSGSQIVEAGCLINWDDLVLDSDIGILTDRPRSSVPSSQNKSHYEQEFSDSESTRSLSHNNYFQSATPPVRLIIDNNISSVSEPKLQANCVLPEDNVKSSPKPICKKLPFVKIPKNCLMKGTILGKGDLSLLSGKSSISFLNNTRTLNTTNVDAVLANPNKLELMKKPSVLNRPTMTRTSLLKQSNKKSEESITVLPVKSGNEISNNSQVNKLHHSRSILKINSANKNGNISKTHSANAGICEKQNTNTCKKSAPVALVSISTDKSDNTTEIVIKTEDGENVYKGKTSDILKATGSTIEFDNPQVSEKLKTPSDKQNYDDATISDLMIKLFGVNTEALEKYEGLATQTHLKCPIEGCKYTSFKGSSMKVHVLQHYGIRPYKCDYPDCTWAFFTNFRLRRHQVIHYEKKVYCCPVVDCGRAFSTIYNVNSHLKLHNRPIAATCQINGCNQAFQTRRGYERHLQEHGINYAPYVCLKKGCGKKYFTVNSLNSHSRSHQHNEEELRCSYCGKVFDQPCRLKAHINIHIGVRPYKCEFEGCMWTFTTSSKLRRHQRKHTQMRKHMCKVCNKSFLRSEHLKDHSLKHFVKKSFICPISGCGTVFSNKSSMYAHLKKHRNQELKPNETTYFPCPMENCSIVFNTKESLRTHMQLSHVLTGLMNNENSQDTIQLLSDDNLITLEGLQGNAPNSGPGVVSFNSMSQEGLLVGMSDLVQCIPVMEQGDFSESNSSNNIITHVVFTDDLDDGKNQTLEEVTKLDETEENIGSARTGIPYQAGVKDKQAVTLAEMAGETSGGLHSASDVVLSAGLLVGHDNLERGLLLQDELSGGDLYPSQEESGLLGAAGELQVLLLDPSTREQTSEFEQSTINLRDLE